MYNDYIDRGDFTQKFNDPSKRREDYKSSHFNEKNILAHVRHDTRTDADGNKVLFIHEVQSDWHKSIRDEGKKIKKYATNNFNSIIKKMVDDGVLEVNCT